MTTGSFLPPIGPDDAIYAISRAGAPNGKIVKLQPPSRRRLAQAPDDRSGKRCRHPLRRRRRARRSISALTAQTACSCATSSAGPTRCAIFDLEGKPEGKLPLPEIAANNEIEPLANGDVLFDVSTYLQPALLRAAGTPATGKTEETALKVTSPVSFADAEVVRDFATSQGRHQGAASTSSRKKGTKLDGSNPTLLYGYGGYGISQTPRFLGAHAPAVARCRRRLCRSPTSAAAREYGERWHQEGMLTKKQNVFDDFAAAAQYLIDQHYTTPRASSR